MAPEKRIHPLTICLLILGTVAIGSCQGVFEMQIEPVSAEEPSHLGQVAYIAGGDVWLLDLDSGEQTRLTRDGYNRKPRLSPDGNWVAYLKGDTLHISDLYNEVETRLSDAGISDYAWSPHGAQLAFASTSGLSIWDGSLRTSRELPVDLPALNRLFWHPDGEWLALDNREGPLRQVIKVSQDGQSQALLFGASGLMDIPRLAGWSPDGAWVALWVGSRAYEAEKDGLPLCFIPTAVGELSCLEENSLLWPDYYSWSQEGRLAYIYGGGRETWVGKGLALYDPRAATFQGLISSGEQAPIQPAWSPAGNQIAYSGGPVTPLSLAYARRDLALAGRQIWVIDITTGRRQQLTSDDGSRDEHPRWSSDGSQLLFVRLDGQAASLWLMNADGSNQHQIVSELTPRPDPQGEYGHIDWGNWWDWRRP